MNFIRTSIYASFISCLVTGFILSLPVSSFGKEDSKKEAGTSVPLLGNDHISSPGSPHIPYNSDPPTSGPHTQYIAPWGIHNAPVLQEMQVHNLEDGGVIIQYHCTNCNEMIKKLEGIVSQYERIILAPYPGLDSMIALTAWGKIDKLKEYDEKRIIRFINAYIGIDHHPQSEKRP
ncbi:MAG: DUF3105 domain-containing protein [Nitrospirae bacterium]|nr:DUF3105 domain-containing protein [Nitrospirota bacterium]